MRTAPAPESAVREPRDEDDLTGVGLEVESPAASEHAGRWGWLGAAISIVTIGAFVWWALNQDPPTIPSSPGGARGAGRRGGGLRRRDGHPRLALARPARRAHVEHETVDAYALIPVGYMGNAILPARGGEVLRVVLLAGRSPARKREIAGSIVAERLLDAAVLAVMFAVLTWIGIAGSPVGQLAGWLAAGGVALLVAVGAAGPAPAPSPAPRARSRRSCARSRSRAPA